MTPKRLRVIAAIIREGIHQRSATTHTIAEELDSHATALELRTRRRKHPVTVFAALAKIAKRGARHEAD